MSTVTIERAGFLSIALLLTSLFAFAIRKNSQFNHLALGHLNFDNVLLRWKGQLIAPR